MVFWVRFLVAIIMLMPAGVYAHAFGQQYTLPLPFTFYAAGASLALLGSFLFLGLYTSLSRPAEAIVVPIPFSPHLSRMFRGVGLFLFVLFLFVALFGPQDFGQSVVPELFWSVFLLGGIYLSSVVDGWWPRLDPNASVSKWISANGPALLEFPEWFKFVPVIAFYYVLIWFELLSYGAGAQPFLIGIFVSLYMVIFCAGVELFGRDNWIRWGDFFSVFWKTIGKVAPVRFSGGAVFMQRPLERLVPETPSHISELIFILFLLASTAFDGLQDTDIWWKLFFDPSSIQQSFYGLERSVLLGVFPILFLLLYALAVYGMAFLTGATNQFKWLMLRFGYSLIPIVIVYNFAHYFTLLIAAVTHLVSLISDPFGAGWNLFGTATWKLDPMPLQADLVWNVQLVVIVGGHVAAAYVAHRIALVVFPEYRKVLLGQLPILLLMVVYTVFGLWILSQSYR